MHVKIISFLIYLIPPFIVAGPFLGDLSLSIVSLYFLIETFRKKLWGYYKNFFVYLFISFYLFILIRSLFTSEILLSLESSLFYCRFLFFSLCIGYIIDSNTQFNKHFFIINEDNVFDQSLK